MRYSAIAIFVAGVLLSGPALAGTQRQEDDRASRVNQLERRADALRKDLVGVQKIGASERDELRRQQSEIRKMIDQLEAGGAVDPQEMDRIQGH